MRVMAGSAAVLAAAILTSCATAPAEFSFLTGERWRKAELNTFDVLIVSVDGRHYIERPGAPVMVTPGARSVVVQGPPAPGFTFGEQRTLKLDVKPCTKYWLEAKKTSPLVQDFEPRVNHDEPIAGCPRPVR